MDRSLSWSLVIHLHVVSSWVCKSEALPHWQSWSNLWCSPLVTIYIYHLIHKRRFYGTKQVVCALETIVLAAVMCEQAALTSWLGRVQRHREIRLTAWFTFHFKGCKSMRGIRKQTVHSGDRMALSGPLEQLAVGGTCFSENLIAGHRAPRWNLPPGTVHSEEGKRTLGWFSPRLRLWYPEDTSALPEGFEWKAVRCQPGAGSAGQEQWELCVGRNPVCLRYRWGYRYLLKYRCHSQERVLSRSSHCTTSANTCIRLLLFLVSCLILFFIKM